jgi:hypothetical protein
MKSLNNQAILLHAIAKESCVKKPLAQTFMNKTQFAGPKQYPARPQRFGKQTVYL